MNGEVVDGIMRTVAEDAEFKELPDQLVVVRKELRKGVKRQRDLDRSDEHLVKDKGKQAWEAAKAQREHRSRAEPTCRSAPWLCCAACKSCSPMEPAKVARRGARVRARASWYGVFGGKGRI